MSVPEHLQKMWGAPKPHDVRFAVVGPDDIKGRVIRCKGYNSNTLSIYDWCYDPQVSKARKPKFMAALRESIQKEGFRNPIICYSIDGALYVSFGGSRALAAQELGVKIPAIINDYDLNYYGASYVDENNVLEFYTDTPKNYEFTQYGYDQHYALERKRRDQYDPAGMAWAEDIPDNSFISAEFGWINED